MVNKKKKPNIIKENKNLPVPASSLEKYLAEISNYKILTKEEEIHKCFHYSNLQPLWAEENLKKSATWSGEGRSGRIS